LGRKAVAEGGAALGILSEEIAATIQRARLAKVDPEGCKRLDEAMAALVQVTQHLGAKGVAGDLEGMLLHSSDYLGLVCVVTVAWQWLLQAAVAREAIDAGSEPADFYQGKLLAAQYWLSSELPRAKLFADLCRSDEDSYGRMKSDWF